MNRISIKLRVVLWYTVIMIAVSAAIMAAMTSLTDKLIEQDSISRTIQTVDDVSKMVSGHRNQPVQSIPEFRFFSRGVHCAVYNDSNILIGGQIPFEFAQIIELSDGNLQNITYGGERYITYVREIKTKAGQSLWIKGVISLSNETQMLDSVIKTNLMLMVILIITAAIGGYLIVSRAFKPVSKISRTAREICESSDLSQRIALGKGRDEIYTLAETFDEMLEKIEQTFEREKQFTSDASHELRTPVAVITSECEYVNDCAKNLDEAKDSVSSIKRQADRMSKLISELLTISRMDRNTVSTSFEQVDISELLGFVCDEQEEIHGGGITLIREIDAGICAEADHFLLARMFINLISNAYQYGKENGTVRVALHKASGCITAEVEDDGIGISEENLPKIWERFYQVDPARTNSGSTGLGLSMVKWIAQCHGGKITVESKLGKGTKFTFTMPEK